MDELWKEYQGLMKDMSDLVAKINDCRQRIKAHVDSTSATVANQVLTDLGKQG